MRFSLRGLDIPENELDKLDLDKDTLHEIAKPFASITERSKLGRTKGRSVIDASDAIDAMIALSMWASRVNKVGKKYRTEPNASDNATVTKLEVVSNGDRRQDVPEQVPVFPGGYNPGFGG